MRDRNKYMWSAYDRSQPRAPSTWLAAGVMLAIFLMALFGVRDAWAQMNDDQFEENAVPAYYYYYTEHPTFYNQNAFDLKNRCPLTTEDAHCYVETAQGIAGFRKGSNGQWILFLSVVNPTQIWRPLVINDTMYGPYAGMVQYITNPTEPPPEHCFSAFGCW